MVRHGLKVLSAVLFTFIFFSINSFGAELKSVTVAGFINTGEPKNDSVNILLTKAFIGFFQKISRDITPYKSVEQRAADTGFWKLKKLDKEAAISVSQPFGSKLTVTGDYLIISGGEKVTVNVFVFDVVTGDQKFKKTFTGKAGIALMDTFNNLIRETAGAIIGKKIEMGLLAVLVEPESRIYKLFINGNYVSDISRAAGFLEEYIGGQAVDISLKNSAEKEVYQKTIVVQKNRTNELVYQPSGILHIKLTETGGGEVFLDGESAGLLDNNGEITINAVASDKNHEVLVKSGGTIIGQENVTVGEGEVRAIALGDASAKRAIFFPIKIGMAGFLTGTFMSAGLDWYIIESLRVFGSGGVILYNNTNLGFGIIPIADAGVGYALPIGKLWKVGVSLSCVAVFSSQISFNPAVNLELEFWRFFLTGGVRYSFLTNGGLNGIFSFGFKI